MATNFTVVLAQRQHFGNDGTRASVRPATVHVGPSRFIHVEQRRDARRAPTDPAATPGRNRDVAVAGIKATFP